MLQNLWHLPVSNCGQERNELLPKVEAIVSYSKQGIVEMRPPYNVD